ncbi:MAG TPA: ribosome biogenesis GTPase Der [Planctomycetota bacterium]|nr:ribosome biogenesis GTPase Der [Planctomycetota bacterium]
MSLPVVSIVGRPNVGKSSLLNCLYRRPVAIVDETPGTTRDRVEVTVRHVGKRFRLVDTGGMGIVDRDDLAHDVARQITIAIEEADVVLFVTDVRDGITTLDLEVATRLRGLRKTVLPVVNKCDTGRWEDQAGTFYALGFGEPLAVSATEGYGRTELLDRISTALPATGVDVDAGAAVKVAVVGKRNVGKSTLVNRLVGEERLITSEVPGTTRDAVDVPFECAGRRFIAIDTAGMRRKRGVHENVDFYSTVRTERSIRRADVVLLLLDAAADVGRVDKKLAGAIESWYRPVVIVINKWDLAQARGLTPESYEAYVANLLPGLDYAPIACVSAREGFNVEPTMALVERLHRQAHTRVATAEVNRVIQGALTRRHPPRRRNRTANVFYATQVTVAPPTVVVFVNDRSLFTGAYVHYLANALRAELPFSEVPVKIELRTRERSPSKKPKDRLKYTEKSAARSRGKKRRGSRRRGGRG